MRRMFATIADIPPGSKLISDQKVATIGDLVLVEVPVNCTIHTLDAHRLARVLTLAEEIGRHWSEQEGINGSLVDQLARETRGESFLSGGALKRYDIIQTDAPITDLGATREALAVALVHWERAASRADLPSIEVMRGKFGLEPR